MRYVATCIPCAQCWGGDQGWSLIRRRNGKPKIRAHGVCERCERWADEVHFVRARHCGGWRSRAEGFIVHIDRDPARPCRANEGIEPCGCSCPDCRKVSPCDHEWHSYGSIGFSTFLAGPKAGLTEEIPPTETTRCFKCGTGITRKRRAPLS